MSGIALARSITSELVLNFQGLASQRSSPAAALRGGATSTDIGSALRVGAQTLASAVQVLNSTISFVNLASADLTNLENLTDRMITLAEEAAGGGVGYQRRLEIDNEYRELASDFQAIVEGAEYNGDNYLTTDGLAAIFARAGLNEEDSQSIEDVLGEFSVYNDGESLADETIVGNRPAHVSQSAYQEEGRTSYTEFEGLFDAARSLTDRVDASVLVEDLNALKSQISDNLEVLNEARRVVGLNVEFVSSTGLAMLEIADQITSADDAAEVAREIRSAVRKDARAALSQAENLEPIIVAALAFGNS
ncbi:MAG: hypothetical protein QY326_08035 [Bdellovibrionota bacterium]|nr:MAG: hypothetical protein QY326_08035 [Bdellovibrionota bacterium]